MRDETNLEHSISRRCLAEEQVHAGSIQRPGKILVSMN